MNLLQLKQIVNTLNIATIPKEILVEKSKGILISENYNPTLPNIETLDVLYENVIERYEFYTSNLFYGSAYYRSAKYHLIDLFKSLEVIL